MWNTGNPWWNNLGSQSNPYATVQQSNFMYPYMGQANVPQTSTFDYSNWYSEHLAAKQAQQAQAQQAQAQAQAAQPAQQDQMATWWDNYLSRPATPQPPQQPNWPWYQPLVQPQLYDTSSWYQQYS